MTSSINTSMGMREWLMLVTLSILWGGSFFFVGVAVAELPPLTIVALRVGLAAITLWIIVLFMGLSLPKSPKVWVAFLIMGLLNNVIPFSLIVWGQTQIASGLASVLNATTPLFGVIVVGFLGVVMIIGIPSLDSAKQGSILAQIAVLGAALSYAFASVFGRRFKATGLKPIIIVAGQVTGPAALLAPVALYIDGPLALLGSRSPSIMVWASILTLAVFLLH